MSSGVHLIAFKNKRGLSTRLACDVNWSALDISVR